MDDKEVKRTRKNHRCDRYNDIYKLLKVGAILRNEDPIKYLTKILVEAVNNDFRRLNV